MHSATSSSITGSGPYGTAPGSAGVDAFGNATYAIPIEPAPGPRGMAPRFALRYSSGGGNGLVGVGWQLSGVSSIHRCKKNLADDGIVVPVFFSIKDPLCLDGERLILESGYHGLDGSIYRPRRTPTQQVEILGSTSEEGSSFRVRTKDGRTLYYGEGERSKLMNGDKPFRWMLTRAVDRFGNKIEYTYVLPTNDDGEEVAILPSAAHYAFDDADNPTRSVAFEYELRPESDVVRRWFYGVPLVLDRRLAAIEVRADAEIVRRFDLDYLPTGDTHTKRSLLSAVHHCDGGGVCKPPTTFEWELGTPGFDDVDLVGENSTSLDTSWKRSTVLDINGDGRHEIVYANDPVYVLGDVTNPGGSVDLSQTWNIWHPDEYWYSTLHLAWAAAGGEYVPLEGLHGDFGIHSVNFNGDGRDDLIVPAHMCTSLDSGLSCYDESIWSVGVGLATCAGISGSVEITPGTITISGCVGIGLSISISEDEQEYDGTDYGARYATGFYILIGEGWLFSDVIVVDDLSNEPIYTFYSGDFDGDGLDDVLLCRGPDPQNAYWVWGNSVVTDGFHHFEFIESQQRCSIGDEILIADRDSDGAEEVLAVPVRIGPVPLPAIERTEYLPLEMGTGIYGTWAGLPRDALQRYFHSECGEEASMSPYRVAGLGKDKLIDWNGDGLVDVLRFELESGDDIEHVIEVANQYPDCDIDEASVLRIYYNTGRGFTPGPVIGGFDDAPYAAYWNRFVPAQTIDWDGNGKVDLLLPQDGDVDAVVEWDVILSYGDTWSTVASGLAWPVASPKESRARITSSIDVNGDGLHDLVFKRGDDDSVNWAADMDVWVHRGSRPDVITTIRDGLGARDVFEYGVTTDPEVHTPASPDECAYPRLCSSDPRVVVAAHRRDLGLEDADLLSERRYHYRGAQSDGLGRGFLGFDHIEIAESSVGDAYPRQTVLEFDRYYDEELADYPTAGRVAARTDQTLFFEGGSYHLRVRREETRREVVEHLLDQGVSYLVYSTDKATSEYQLAGTECGDPGELCGASDLDAKTPARWGTATMIADAYGNIETFQGETSDGHRRVVQRTWNTDLDAWDLARLRSERVTSVAADGSSKERFAEITERYANGAVRALVIEPGSDAYEIEVAYEYDAHGNVESITRTAADDTVVSTSTTWDPLGLHPTSHVDAAGLSHGFAFESGLGVMTRYVRPSGVTMVASYDGFGRQSGLVRAAAGSGVSDGGWTTISMMGPSSYPGSVYRVHRDTNGQPVTTVDFDRLGRPIRVLRDGFVGEDDPDGYEHPHGDVYRTLDYDRHYRLARRSLWTPIGEDPLGYDTFAYDELDRPTVVETAAGAATMFSYPTLRRQEILGPDGSEEARVFDAAGDLVQTTNGVGAMTCFEWGPFRVLERVVRDCHPGGTQVATSYDYDRYGRLVGVTKPDAGTRTYDYDPFGRLDHSVDTEGNHVVYERDGIGRLTKRIDAAGETTFEWDTLVPGLLTEHTTPDGVTKRYRYDEFDRLERATLEIDEEAFTFEYGYDSFARLQTIAYPAGAGDQDLGLTLEQESRETEDDRNSWTTKPSTEPGLIVEIVYDAHGYERQVRNAVDRFAYWTAVAATPAGSITEHRYGNDVVSYRTYDPLTERVDFVRTISPVDGAVQLDDPTWTKGGDLRALEDLVTGQLEEYEYDGAHRLTQALITAPGGETALRETRYDAVDNITFRTETGDYEYEGQLVTAAGSHTFAWDDDGRLDRRDADELTYTAFDKVARIVGPGGTTTLTYDGDQQLARREDPDGREIVYAGSLYERETSGSGHATHRFKIPTPYGPAAIVSESAVAGTVVSDVRYLHPDHLGSTQVITDESGAVTGRLDYDPWGQRRDPDDWTKSLTNGASPNTTNVGFTGHEQRDLAGLINMTGRLYDPEVGRFTTPDPVVADAYSQISYNPYAYAFDNPTRFIDPDGFAPEVILVDENGQEGPWTRQVNVHTTDPVVDVVFGDWTIPARSPSVGGVNDRGPETDTRGGTGVQGGPSASSADGGSVVTELAWDLLAYGGQELLDIGVDYIVDNAEPIILGALDGLTFGVSTMALEELGYDVPTDNLAFIASSWIVPVGAEGKVVKAIGGKVVNATKALPPVGGTSRRITREMRWMQLADLVPDAHLPKEVVDHIRRHDGARVWERFGLELSHRAGKTTAKGHDYAEALPAWSADHRGIFHRYVIERRTSTRINTTLKPRNGKKLDLPPKGSLP